MADEPPAVKAFKAFLQRGDGGRIDVHADSREELLACMRAARTAGAETVVVLRGLTATPLGAFSVTICDAAIELNVPIAFTHRGRTLQLARVDLPPSQAGGRLSPR